MSRDLVRGFRAWTVTAAASTSAAVIPFPCIVDAVVITRLGVGGAGAIFDSVSSASGNIFWGGDTSIPFGLTGLNARFENGLWLQNTGGATAAWWTFIAVPI